jgi:hypothetical protein
MNENILFDECQYCLEKVEPGEFHACKHKAAEDVIKQHCTIKVTRNRDGSLFSVGIERGVEGTITMKEMDRKELELIDNTLRSTLQATDHERRRVLQSVKR